jgi:hypothetical protein
LPVVLSQCFTNLALVSDEKIETALDPVDAHALAGLAVGEKSRALQCQELLQTGLRRTRRGLGR